MSFLYKGFDENKIIIFEQEGKIIYNPFEIGLQAMIGENVAEVYNDSIDYLYPRYYPIRYLDDPRNDEYALSAIDWILKKEVSRGDKSFWKYEYNAYFNNEKIPPPWTSSFGQAYIALACLLWYKFTQEQHYRRLSLRALYGIAEDITKGGNSFSIEGGIWFEEIPSKRPTHIFNAHLISLIAMLEANDIFAEKSLSSIIDSGIETFRKLHEYMDTGVWSAYDLPEKVDILLQLCPEDPGRTVKLKEITIIDGTGNERYLDLSSNDCFSPGNQWISGIDWGAVDQQGYREILSGETLHPEPVPTGSRQNSYINFKEVNVTDSIISIIIKYKSEHDTVLLINRNDHNGNFVPLGFIDSFPVKKGENVISMKIQKSAFSPPLSEVYHLFHILLLEELLRWFPEKWLERLIIRFKTYYFRRKK